MNVGARWMALVLFGLAGCTHVYAPRPVGGKPHPLPDDTWAGTWIHKDGALTVDIADASNGVLRVSWIDKDAKAPKMRSCEVRILESGDSLLGSVADEDDASRFLWGKLRRNGEMLVLWAPNVPKFRALVEAGKLPGRVSGQDVVLGVLGTNHLQTIVSDAEGVLFDWEDPMVFFRLAR